MSENYWDKLMGDDASAANYMETYGEGTGSETRRIVFAFINPGESVLDVGCGPGWNLEHGQIHEGLGFGFNYKGLDYSERFVRVANARHPEKDPPYFQMGDCRHLEEPDGSYDVVLLQDVLEHTNGYEGPVREALRVARKRVIVTFWRMNEETRTKINIDGDDGFGGEYNRQEWQDYLTQLEDDGSIHIWEQTESSPEANRHHLFYILEKEEI